MIGAQHQFYSNGGSLEHRDNLEKYFKGEKPDAAVKYAPWAGTLWRNGCNLDKFRNPYKRGCIILYSSIITWFVSCLDLIELLYPTYQAHNSCAQIFLSVHIVLLSFDWSIQPGTTPSRLLPGFSRPRPARPWWRLTLRRRRGDLGQIRTTTSAFQPDLIFSRPRSVNKKHMSDAA